MSSIRLRLGPLLFCALVALSRAVWLSLQLSGLRASEVGYLLLADLPVLGALMLLAWGEARGSRRQRAPVLLLTIVLVFLYVGDVLAVVALNSRLQLDDIRRFATDWWLLPSYLDEKLFAVLAALVACFFVTIRMSARAIRIAAIASICVLLGPLVVPFTGAEQAIPSHLQKYTGSVFLLAKEAWGLRRPPASRYQSGDFNAYRAEYDTWFDVPIAKSRRNIVLVIVESLSSVDSYRTSGLGNLLPRFDELGREGMLFRNFLANFEASEGGIVALLSGVPPLHFPTASTNTFGEYSLQRSTIRSLARSGYRCEFLTSVPIDFISMDAYARSSVVGFSHAAGQKEIARYRGAPKYGFESPTDHLLYEEVLARLAPPGADAGQPVFLAAITASSHPPFVDPLGRGNTEQNVWAYVQEELWWLYRELDRRRFFENGLLLITGDHRKMFPVRQEERERFGESAKARIPLVVIGTDVPRGVVDDRLFQQADLLRMLDRAVRPGAPLSPFTVWPERYMFVFGIASNASNVQIFEARDGARQAFRMNLKGAEIEWLSAPPDSFEVERAIHRQRAMQQAARAERVNPPALTLGRDLSPSPGARGVLVGASADANPSRDPDDPCCSMKQFRTGTFEPAAVRRLAGLPDGPVTLTARGFLQLDREGQYWFSVYANRAACLAIDGQVVLGCMSGLNEGVAFLSEGLHRFDLRFLGGGSKEILEFRWLPPGAPRFEDFPQEKLLLPRDDG